MTTTINNTISRVTAAAIFVFIAGCLTNQAFNSDTERIERIEHRCKVNVTDGSAQCPAGTFNIQVTVK